LPEKLGRRSDLTTLVRPLSVAVPPSLVVAWLLLSSERDARSVWLFAASVALSVLLAVVVSRGLSRRLRTISSVLAALRDGDFSIRARRTETDTVLDDVLRELNELGNTLREHRLSQLESWTLLQKVLAELDVVVLAFDQGGGLKLSNDAASRALGAPMSKLVGRAAAELGLDVVLHGAAPRIIEDCPPLGGSNAWELRRSSFRLEGQVHSLVVLSDVSGALRDQERDAWKRLIRVLGHELNNSLAPIQSISENLLKSIERQPRPDDWEGDAKSGLSVIQRRAAALTRFTAAYARLARLPPPTLRPLSIAECVRRAVRLEQRLAIEVIEGEDATVMGDPDQLDQLLINLIKNAVEATCERRGRVFVRWKAMATKIDVLVEDEGHGISETDNLFVPFFTTKADGSGIGLTLARQIAEAHHGSLRLKPRHPQGAVAILQLPLAQPDFGPTAPRPSSHLLSTTGPR
jgi:two-component system, NtrC family, nitrogen regulation sensor histidine kinase NtrY